MSNFSRYPTVPYSDAYDRLREEQYADRMPLDKRAKGATRQA